MVGGNQVLAAQNLQFLEERRIDVVKLEVRSAAEMPAVTANEYSEEGESAEGRLEVHSAEAYTQKFGEDDVGQTD